MALTIRWQACMLVTRWGHLCPVFQLAYAEPVYSQYCSTLSKANAAPIICWFVGKLHWVTSTFTYQYFVQCFRKLRKYHSLL